MQSIDVVMYTCFYVECGTCLYCPEDVELTADLRSDPTFLTPHTAAQATDECSEEKC